MHKWPTDKHLLLVGTCPDNRSVAAKYSPRAVDGSKIAPVAPCAWPPKVSARAPAIWGVHRRMRSKLDRPSHDATAHKLAKIIYHMLKDKHPIKNVVPSIICTKIRSARSDNTQASQAPGFDLVLQTAIIHRRLKRP